MEAPVYGEACQHVLPLHRQTHYFDFPPPPVHQPHRHKSPASQLWLHLIKWEFCNSNELYIHKKSSVTFFHFENVKIRQILTLGWGIKGSFECKGFLNRVIGKF